ncbi:tryptophan--tRNA ligase [Candidatus Phytoplasma phoenicium]|uniref:Tryptophan--tRNA ligase n=1 Tax=Candidatus Phytoplasma phoenicium TaxID=198422 RepID=A0A2S8NV28_9MOLU|nr:tryptophan--tRNA ligase [Candidatus Phytoplasma phoenicium]
MIKKTIVSGIKPTGEITLGNYLGVIKPLISFQRKFNLEYEYYLFIADLHALTVYQKPSVLQERIKKTALIYLSAGFDMTKTHLFVQSEIPQHTYLSYLLESNSYFSELKHMIQFKEKIRKERSLKGIRTSLFTYPILMASDILIYDANIVPVGQDQKQHLELTRLLATRFNDLYGKTFCIPQFLKIGHLIKSLNNPLKKMNKSDQMSQAEDKGCICLLEDLKIVKDKIMKAVTDSENKIKYEPEKQPGISNLLIIYASLKEWDLNATVAYFQYFSYKKFKEEVANVVVEHLRVFQEKFHNYERNNLLSQFLEEGAAKARIIAEQKILQIKKRMGIQRY